VTAPISKPEIALSVSIVPNLSQPLNTISLLNGSLSDERVCQIQYEHKMAAINSFKLEQTRSGVRHLRRLQKHPTAKHFVMGIQTTPGLPLSIGMQQPYSRLRGISQWQSI
jgi:hypothetical protein